MLHMLMEVAKKRKYVNHNVFFFEMECFTCGMTFGVLDKSSNISVATLSVVLKALAKFFNFVSKTASAPCGLLQKSLKLSSLSL